MAWFTNQPWRSGVCADRDFEREDEKLGGTGPALLAEMDCRRLSNSLSALGPAVRFPECGFFRVDRRKPGGCPRPRAMATRFLPRNPHSPTSGHVQETDGVREKDEEIERHLHGGAISPCRQHIVAPSPAATV